MRPAGLFDLPDHLVQLSKTGDPLEVLNRVVDFEHFREPLERALGDADGLKGGSLSYGPVVTFKVLILAARHTVHDAAGQSIDLPLHVPLPVAGRPEPADSGDRGDPHPLRLSPDPRTLAVRVLAGERQADLPAVR